MKYVLDSHTHTLASGHAYSTIHEMVYAAEKKGLELLGITEHAMKMPGACHKFYFMNLRVMERKMSGIEVMFGAEVNIMDYEGNVDMNDYLLKTMDVVIASLHSACFTPGSKEQNTAAVLGAMKNPYVNILGHPDDASYPLNYEAVVVGAKECGVLLELNNSSLNPKGHRKNPIPNDVIMLELCKKYHVPILLGSDAHVQESVGDYRYLEPLLECVNFPEELIVNRSVAEYKKYINRFKHQ